MVSRRDYCPIACGVDVLGDRWTPLVIRELMVGARGFNEIHRGIPRVSRTLLAQRLRELERRGLMTQEASQPGRPPSRCPDAGGHVRAAPSRASAGQ
jgi:DNA-binding HxlR family transcriptional regulator